MVFPFSRWWPSADWVEIVKIRYLPKLAEISHAVTEILLFYFQDDGIPPSWILKIWKFYWLTVQRVEMHHRAELR